MTDIVHRIAEYPALSPAERAEIEAYVALHPEWAADLRAAAALAAALQAAADSKPEDALAAFVVDEALGLVSPEAEQTRDALAQDPALATEADGLRSRLGELLDGMHESPTAHFERLSGRSLAAPASRPADREAAAPPRAADRGAVAPPRRVRSRRRAGWALSALAVAYVALFAVSAAWTPERTRLAALDEITVAAPQVVRGSSSDALAQRLSDALDGTRAARRTTLGLFPRYDVDALDTAADSLVAVSSDAPPASTVALDARLALGRIRVQQGRDAEAVRILGALVREGNYPAPAARRLLDGLR